MVRFSVRLLFPANIGIRIPFNKGVNMIAIPIVMGFIPVFKTLPMFILTALRNKRRT